MARRSLAREVALQMLFQIDLNPDVDIQDVAEMMGERLKDAELREFAWGLFSGVREYRAMLDERIESTAENWKLSRMAATDRNCLRLGAFELLQTSTPHRVVIDEALDLARKFGNERSAPFVNGILDKLVPAEKRGGDTGTVMENGG
ncbi:MAG: transcription antitermination factor NusB [Planctomycetaceae bacterium]|nr:transcription antitermination factor NusB [Planctomycetaceae bacterium]